MFVDVSESYYKYVSSNNTRFQKIRFTLYWIKKAHRPVQFELFYP